MAEIEKKVATIEKETGGDDHNTENKETTNVETDAGTKTSVKRLHETLLCEDCKKKRIKLEEYDNELKPCEGFDDKFTKDGELIAKSFMALNIINNVSLETFMKTNLWASQIVNFITDRITIWFDKNDKIVMRVRRPDNSIHIYNSSDFYKITAIFYATKKSKSHDKFLSYYFEPAALSSVRIIEKDGCKLNRFISISDETPQKFPPTIPEKTTDSFIFVVKNGFVAHKMQIANGETEAHNTAYIKFNNVLYQIEKKNTIA